MKTYLIHGEYFNGESIHSFIFSTACPFLGHGDPEPVPETTQGTGKLMTLKFTTREAKLVRFT